MTPATVIDYTYQALILALLLSLPAVLTAGIVGFVVALLQAVTQIQDQSIGQAAKLLAVGAALAVAGGWIWSEMSLFGDAMFRAVATLH
ncbi:MAG: type III secretion system export apparatus subunit SctS [Burkholderiaceae bacterium]